MSAIVSHSLIPFHHIPRIKNIIIEQNLWLEKYSLIIGNSFDIYYQTNLCSNIFN